jgi:hypothetical protein
MAVRHDLRAVTGCRKLDNRNRKAREIVQRCNDARSLHNVPLVERYIKGELDLVIRRINADPDEYGIILKACPSMVGEFKSIRRPVRSESCEGRHGRNLHQTSMLSRLIYFVEGVEKSVTVLPRLQAFDGGAIGIGKPLYLFATRVLPMEELIGRGTDGKLTVTWNRVAIAHSEGVYENVEAASQAVNDRAGFCIDDSGNRLNISKLDAFLAFFRVQFFNQTIRGILFPGLNSPIEDLELGYGPINAGLSV